MSHSQRCISYNRFGDGFDCICDEEPLPKALAEIEALKQKLVLANQKIGEYERAVSERVNESEPVMVAGGALAGMSMSDEHERKLGEMAVSIHAGIAQRILRSEVDAAIQLMNDAGVSPMPDWAWVESLKTALVIVAPEGSISPNSMRVRRSRPLGTVLKAAEAVALQVATGNAPSDESLVKLAEAYELHENLARAMHRCLVCGHVVCECPPLDRTATAKTVQCNEHVPNEERPTECARCGKPC